MRFRSAKQAIGYYGARRQGPRMAGLRVGPPTSSSSSETHATHVRIGSVLSRACASREQLERLVEWSRTADEGGPGLTRGDRGALDVVRDLLDEMGLLEEPIRPMALEDVEFVDLETGRAMRTRRGGRGA